MIRALKKPQSAGVCFPRVSGDEPFFRSALQKLVLFSLLTRG